MIRAPDHRLTSEAESAPAPDDCEAMNNPPTTAVAHDSISSSTVTPKAAGSPAFIRSKATKPGVKNMTRTSRVHSRGSRSGGRRGSACPLLPMVGLAFDIISAPRESR